MHAVFYSSYCLLWLSTRNSQPGFRDCKGIISNSTRKATPTLTTSQQCSSLHCCSTLLMCPGRRQRHCGYRRALLLTWCGGAEAKLQQRERGTRRLYQPESQIALACCCCIGIDSGPAPCTLFLSLLVICETWGSESATSSLRQYYVTEYLFIFLYFSRKVYLTAYTYTRGFCVK